MTIIKSNGLQNVKQLSYVSTKTVLLPIKNDVYLSLARAEESAVVLLDQLAALDTTDPDILLNYQSFWLMLSV